MFKRVYIEITNICNLNCDFCPISKREKRYMTIYEYEYILKKISGYTNHIYLHVKGEPLMHKDLDEILKISNKYNMNVNITTNARLLKDKLDIINGNKIRQINISLHSFTNLNEIEDLLSTIDKINNCYISLRLWNNKDNSDVINILNNHYNTNIVINSKRTKITDRIFIDRDIRFNWPDINIDVIDHYGTCKALKEQIAILVDGTVVSCCLDNEGYNNFGNIFNEELEEILNGDKYLAMKNGFKNNKLLSELCKRCGYRERFK